MIRLLAFIAISITLAGTAIAAPARNQPTLEQRARQLVERHFTALAAGDAKALSSIWAADATVTSATADGRARVVPIATALSTWLGARDGVHGKVRRAHRRGHRIEVDAIVRWNGTLYRDRLIVTADRRGNLKIASKVTSPIDREAPGKVGYGG